MYFLFYSSALSYIFHLSVEGLTVFLHSPEFDEHFKTITLNSLSGKLLVSVSLGFFYGFILFFCLEHIPLTPHVV